MLGGRAFGSFPAKPNQPNNTGPRVLKGRHCSNQPTSPDQGPRVKQRRQIASRSPGLEKSTPEVSWAGIVHGVSGYAKANREILKRLMSDFRVSLRSNSPWVATQADHEATEIWKACRGAKIGPDAPSVTFLPPQVEAPASKKIIYTMMETEVVHGEMIRLMNDYDECWTPTNWNARTFRDSGLRIPVHVIPLGVDSVIYSPRIAPAMPKATLISTIGAGRVETPSGFVFVFVFQPSFRKGLDFLVRVFEETFSKDPGVGLLLGTTAYSLSDCYPKFPDKTLKSRVWALDRRLSEHELAGMYRACGAYVSPSRGEGFDMPLIEAASCGLPVIASRCSSHQELVPKGHGFTFEPDSFHSFPDADRISTWFGGMPFADFGAGAHKQLKTIFQAVRKHPRDAAEMGAHFGGYVRQKYSWDKCVTLISERLLAKK